MLKTFLKNLFKKRVDPTLKAELKDLRLKRKALTDRYLSITDYNIDGHIPDEEYTARIQNINELIEAYDERILAIRQELLGKKSND